MRQSYTDIINKYDFDSIQISLGSWKSEFDEVNQALRSAFMFTIIGFLYGDNRHLYKLFYAFFENEFSKRIAFIDGMWKTKRADEKI